MDYIGLMSGTSIDAVDAVVLSIPEKGPPVLKTAQCYPYPEPVRTRLLQYILATDIDAAGLGELDTVLGEHFASAANAVLKESGLRPADIRAIGSHGQTLRHQPRGKHPFSLQIGSPSVIAERTGITTVADFRARDIAAGGQGAPLVPAFHAHVFRTSGVNRVIINIGGIANVSYLPGDPTESVSGLDTGPGNTLLDQWINRRLNKRYDRDGAWAAGGSISGELLQRLLADPYFHRSPPKSTGREDFHLAWLERHLDQGPHLDPRDIQATLTELTARTLADAVHSYYPKTQEVYLCGGGAHNACLMTRLQENLAGLPLADSGKLGLPPDWVEAAAFAWLAHRTMEGLPGNLPAVTGAKRPVVLGGIYPGARG